MFWEDGVQNINQFFPRGVCVVFVKFVMLNLKIRDGAGCLRILARSFTTMLTLTLC